MSFTNWLRTLRSALAPNRMDRKHWRQPFVRATPYCPRLEVLDDRCLPSFSPAVNFGVGIDPQEVTTGDFNGDGRPDLATAGSGGNGISLLLGNGDGTFQAVRNVAIGTAPKSVLAADLNGDGKSDLVSIVSWYSEFDQVLVLLSNGDGTFSGSGAVVLSPLNPTGYNNSGPLVDQTAVSVAGGDLNADGRIDMLVGGQTHFTVVAGYDDYGSPYYTDYYEGFTNVFLGNGDGTFGAAGTYYHGASPVQIGDFTGDGRPDVVTSYGWLFRGNGDGSLQNAQPPTIEIGIVDKGDFDRDGKLDLLTQSSGLLLGNGDGTFHLVATGLPGNASVPGDVNADGKQDIVGLDASHVWVVLGHGDGTFAAPMLMTAVTPTNHYFSSAALADFDGDGFPDLAVSAPTGAAPGLVAVSRNDGNWTVPPPLPPAIAIGDVSVSEGNTGTRAATFSVSLSKSWDQPVTVAYATSNGTAVAGSDYQATSGTLTFAPGETSKTITAVVNGDRVGEANETFSVNLSIPTNATIADGQGQGTIVDDEPRISIGDVTKAEGKKNQTTLFTFTVTLSAAYDQAVTMSFATANGTAKTSDNDYIAKTGTLTFAPGETTKTITIEVKGDSKKEANEYFYLDLFGNSSNSLFGKKRGVGTILNDD